MPSPSRLLLFCSLFCLPPCLLLLLVCLFPALPSNPFSSSDTGSSICPSLHCLCSAQHSAWHYLLTITTTGSLPYHHAANAAITRLPWLYSALHSACPLLRPLLPRFMPCVPFLLRQLRNFPAAACGPRYRFLCLNNARNHCLHLPFCLYQRYVFMPPRAAKSMPPFSAGMWVVDIPACHAHPLLSGYCHSSPRGC